MNYLLWNLLGPASWIFWLVALAAAGIFFRSPRLTRTAVIAAAVVALVLAVLPTGFVLMHQLESHHPAPAAIPADVRHIVVLAGAERLRASSAAGRLELNMHAERVTEPLALARAIPAAKLWIVGGISRGGPRRDVDWTADYWRRAGIAPTRIGKIGGTVDTCGNAAGIAAALAGERILLVTSAFHMPRALACLDAAGVAAVPYPVDRQTWDAASLGAMFSGNLAQNAELAALAMHEYAGLGYYRLRGRIEL